MLKIYDTNYDYVASIDVAKDLCITSTLKEGFNTLSFKLPLTDEYLALIGEEYYVELDNYSYVIKEINLGRNDFIQIFCNPNIETLKYNLVSIFDAVDINIEQAINRLLVQSQSGWTLEYNSTLHQDRVEYRLATMTPYEILLQIKEDFSLEYWFDTKNKILKVFDYMGANRGTYFSNDKRLKLLNKQGQSYDFITVIYPIGKNGIVIGPINNGLNILENYQYCNKYKPIY